MADRLSRRLCLQTNPIRNSEVLVKRSPLEQHVPHMRSRHAGEADGVPVAWITEEEVEDRGTIINCKYDA